MGLCRMKIREGKETIVSDQLSVSEIELLKTETPRTDEAFDREHWVGVDDALVDCARELERELNGLKAAVRAYYDNGCGENFVKLCVLAGATGSENVTWPDGQPGKDGG